MRQTALIALLLFYGVVNAKTIKIGEIKSDIKEISQKTAHIGKPDFGTIKPTRLGAIKGYVMTHEHPTAGMAFGGNYAFTGSSNNYINGVMENGYTQACFGCDEGVDCSHGEFKGKILEMVGGISNTLLPQPYKTHDLGAHPSHHGPTQNSFSHLRYSTEWIREAFRPSQIQFSDARMRIMVAYAIENEALCDQLFEENLGHGGPGEPGYICPRGDSFQSLERQIQSLHAWANANADIEIALSAEDARRIANEDKLVVVLGVEADHAFGAENSKFDPVDRLNDYYEMGVRTFYFSHKINSRLSGADVFRSKSSIEGRVFRMTQAVMGCLYVDDNVAQFPLSVAGHNFCDNNAQCGPNAIRGPANLATLENLIPRNLPLPPLWNALDNLSPDQCNTRYSQVSETNQVIYSLLASEQMNGFKVYPSLPGFSGTGGTFMELHDDADMELHDDADMELHDDADMELHDDADMELHDDADVDVDIDIERNNLGLSTDGFRVANEAMHKGMLINIDHVSSKARKELAILADKTFGGYPLNAFHNNPNEMMAGDSSNSIHPSEYDFDKAERDIIRLSGGFFGVRLAPMKAKDYPNADITESCDNSSTENGKILASLLDEGLSVGYALDFAASTKGTLSRTSECNGNGGGNDYIHTYDSNQVGGLQHIGMMKKWHKELESVGLKDNYLDQLKNDGAEQFLQMWEHSEERGMATPRISTKPQSL